jgi:molybdopterin converting factor small subunit
MEVTVKFFSYCRIMAGTDKLSLGLPEGASIADLMEKLRRTLGKPDLGKEKITFMVNQKQASLETALHDKDEIALLYLIGGG